MKWIERDFGYQSLFEISQQMDQLVKQADHRFYSLWYGEHHCVVSKGTRAHSEVIDYWPSCPVNRGGLLTVHLPGQLVFYPIWRISQSGISLDRYRWILEESVIRVVTSFSNQQILCYRNDHHPGVFTSRGKLASLGLRLSHHGWISHGLSFNIACPLKPMHSIVCCGLSEILATRLVDHSLFISMQDLKRALKNQFMELMEEERLLCQ